MQDQTTMKYTWIWEDLDIDYYFQFLTANRGIEYWDIDCLPTPTPRATTPAPVAQVTATATPLPPGTPTLTAAAPTSAPTAAQPTPPPGEVVFFTRPSASGPCTQVRFHFQTDDQGRLVFTKPFLLTYYGLTYRISLSPQAVQQLDAYRWNLNRSPEDFRQLLAEAMTLETRLRDGSWARVRADLSPQAPPVRLLDRIWHWRAYGFTHWWRTSGPVHWHDPDCETRPTPTALPAGPSPSPTVWQVAATATPLPPGAPTPTPGPSPTPTPVPPTATPTPTAAPLCQEAEDVTREVLAYINEIRQQHGLPPVSPGSAALRKAVKELACLMQRYNDDSHSPGGVTPRERLQRYGVVYQVYVENIAMASSPQEAAYKWRDSAGHLANMLNSSITGCAVAFSGRYYALGCTGP